MTYAGFPSDLKGPAIGTWFISPYSMTADKRGHIYIIDERRKQIYKYTIAAQTIEILAGNSRVGLKDGPALKASFEKPCSLAVDSKGNVYITEYRGHTVRKIDVSKKVVTTILGNGKAGYANGSPLQASLNYPCGIAVDKQDNLYVGDKTSIRKLTPGGVLSTFAGGATGGTKDGKQGVGQIAHPVELRFDSKGNLIT
jgi:DNA-binding beta-propeller fold protein YncE